MGPGQKFLTGVRSGQILVARVRSGQPFLVWVWIWKISPKNVNFLNFLPLSLGRVKKYPGQSRVGLLFTAGQKYVWVGSDQVRANLYFKPISHTHAGLHSIEN